MTPPLVDPRIERSRTVILEAALEELADVGYGAFTVEGVARRAGVSKATVYRHWDGKLELVSDAVLRLKQLVKPPDSGDARERIRGLLIGIAEMLAGSKLAPCVPAVISAAERDPSIREFHHKTSAERRAFFVGLLDQARDAGHLDPDVDTTQLAELLVAPIFFRRLMTPDPFTADDVDKLLAMVLDPLALSGARHFVAAITTTAVEIAAAESSAGVCGRDDDDGCRDRCRRIRGR